jgi:uncharacterized protein involved in exopolysaccharide biosynthesis
LSHPSIGDLPTRDEELSLFTLSAILLRNRWRIARWALAGGVMAAAAVAWKPALYRASASFVTQGGGENARSGGLASLAGQFGVSIPAANASQSPEFYQRLVRSRVILQPILHMSVPAAGSGGGTAKLIDLLEIEGETPKRRDELGVTALQGIVAATVAKPIGAVEVSAATEWPTVSEAIVNAVITGVNDFNERTRQTQTSGERRFAEQVMAVKLRELQEAEERVKQFLRSNRVFRGSPDLENQHESLQRDVMMKQQVYTTVAQSYEDAKIREVRDTPVITVLEPAYVPTIPEPRGRIASVIVGILFGAFVGALVSILADALVRRHREGSADATELVAVATEIKDSTLKRFRRSRGGG